MNQFQPDPDPDDIPYLFDLRGGSIKELLRWTKKLCPGTLVGLDIGPKPLLLYLPLLHGFLLQ